MGVMGLILNENNSHFFGSRTEAEMTHAGLKGFVDQYSGTQVSHLFFCPNAMRTNYRSRVFEPIWEAGAQIVPSDNPCAVNWVRNARLLDREGVDPYVTWIERCRKKGISPWLSMRMNDVHAASDLSCFMHSPFWLAHPEYWRVPGSNNGNWLERAFDYSHPEVRAYHMNLIREYFERYDIDGLELDWMRFGYHFKPGHEAEGAEILTAFMREVRELAGVWSKKRGRTIKVGARVPTHPEAARGLGMDGVRWVREGLVDMLVPTPSRATADFDIPMELWRELCGQAAEKVVFGAGLEFNLRPFPAAQPRPNDAESVRGFAASMLDRGADQIYLFNFTDRTMAGEGSEDYRQILKEAASLETVVAKPRRHVVTYADTLPPGVAARHPLPVELRMNEQAQFRIHTGPRPTQGLAVIWVGLADRPGVKDARFMARLNSVNCASLSDGMETARFSQSARMLRFEIPLEAMQRGYNLVELLHRDGEPQQVAWVEIRIIPN